DRVSLALTPDAHFVHVHSLTTANHIYAEDGRLVTGRFLAELPATPEATERKRRAALGSQLFARRLVAADSRATVILAELAHPGGSDEYEKPAVQAVRAAIARLPPPPGVRVDVTGSPVIDVESCGLLIADQSILVPIAVILILGAALLV